MEVKQIYTLVNDITKEVLGESVIVKEDLSNIVDLGTAYFNANAVENFTKTLVDKVGKMVFTDRLYKATYPSIMKDAWEYGAVLEKVDCDLPEATENESWELEDGASYDPNIVTMPKVSVKFYSKKTTFEVPMTFTELQIKSAFNSASEMNRFVSMIRTKIENKITVSNEEVQMRVVNAMIGETIHDANSVRAVNLLSLYNTTFTKTLTLATALYDAEFLKFATKTIALYVERFPRYSTLFNIGGKERFTPTSKLHVVGLADFTKACNSYLQADTYHKELVSLPNGLEEVAYWQGTGTGYGLADVSKVDIKTPSGDNVSQTGIIAVMFDDDCVAVCNENKRIKSHYNEKAEFVNEWYKVDCSYFADKNENFVVFYLA